MYVNVKVTDEKKRNCMLIEGDVHVIKFKNNRRELIKNLIIITFYL